MVLHVVVVVVVVGVVVTIDLGLEVVVTNASAVIKAIMAAEPIHIHGFIIIIVRSCCCLDTILGRGALVEVD